MRRISSSAWEQVQCDLVEDFVDLFLPPSYPFAVEANYPVSASTEALMKDRLTGLALPEKKLLRIEQLLEECGLEDFPSRFGDSATLFAYDLLQGFGQGPASNLHGATFEGLRQMANTWGLHLAREMERASHMYELFTIFPDFLAHVARQIPAKEFGEAIREATTPAFLRAGELIRYDFALLDNDQPKLKESLSILEASDAELEREIASIFSGYSAKQIGSRLQRTLVELVSELKELFSSNEFRERYLTIWPMAFRSLSWYIGRRLCRNLQNDPQRTVRLLEAISCRKEIAAVFEEYHYKYGWQGDRNRAIELGWQAVAPKFFHLSGRMEDVKEDEDQEKLIGLAQGLNDYTDKNRPTVAIRDGLFGKLSAYLKTAAKNQELDYLRGKDTDGNRALTEAMHSEDLTSKDEENDELSDDEILSRQQEKSHPSGDRVFDEVGGKETLEIWHKTLTEREKTAVELKANGYREKEIANKMGISQQRVSQLVEQAWIKWHNVPR